MDPDAQLYAAWQAGDKKAGAQLVERYYDPVLRFFRTKVGPQADDLVQRTFLGCAEAGARFRGDASFRSFLFGVARNILFEHFRGAKRDAKVDADFGVSSVHDLAPGPSTIANNRFEQRLLVEALRRLPVDIQITLELFYWEDMSVTELAAVLEIPEGTVKSRLYRGRTLLKEIMQTLPASTDERKSVRVVLGEWVDQMKNRIDEP